MSQISFTPASAHAAPSVRKAPSHSRPYRQDAPDSIRFGRKFTRKPAVWLSFLAPLIAIIPPSARPKANPAPEERAACEDDGRRISVAPLDPARLTADTIARAVSDHRANLADYARPAVVRILSPQGSQAITTGGDKGAGFICRSDGLILTNWHVISGAAETEGKEVEVLLSDGRVLTGRVIGGDPKADVAVVRVQTDAPLPTLQLGDSDAVRVGETVSAFGHPFVFDWSFTSGTVSGRRRGLIERFTTLSADLLQIDATLNPGNSGGPLLDPGGKVLGINTAIFHESPTTGFAVSAGQIARVLHRVDRNRTMTRLRLGVAFPRQAARDFVNTRFPLKATTEEERALIAPIRNLLNEPRFRDVDGIIVMQVNPDPTLPANRAGLQPGDIITEVNGVKLGASVDNYIGWHYADEAVELKIFRRGEFLTLTLNPPASERPQP